jgi:hypothetical protein
MTSTFPGARPRRWARLSLQPLEDRACPATFAYAAATQTLTLTAADADQLLVESLAGKPPGYVLVRELGANATVFESDTVKQPVRNLILQFANVGSGFLGLDKTLNLGGNVTVFGAQSSQGVFVDGVVGGNVTYTRGSPSAADDIRFRHQAEVGGTVTLGLGGGTNSVKFEQGTFHGAVSVTGGAGPDAVEFGAAGAVNIAGSATFRLRGGTNAVTAAGSAGIHVGGNLTYFGGTGNDTIDLDVDYLSNRLEVGGSARISLATIVPSTDTNMVKFGTLAVDGSLTLTGGNGNDYVHGFGDLTVGRNLTAGLGNGSNTFNPDTFATQVSAVGGSLTYTGGLQADVVTFDNMTVGKNVIVALSACDPGGGQYFRAGVFGTGGVIVHGSMKVTGGSQLDTIGLERLGVGGSLTVMAGGGSDFVYVNDAAVAGATLIDLGAGTDSLVIELPPGGNPSPGPVQFGGAVTVRGGAGDDNVRLSGDADPATYLHFGSRLVLLGGTGSDTVWNDSGNIFEVPVTVQETEQVIGPALP